MLGVPGWAAALGGILALCLPVVFKFFANQRKQRKADEKKIETAPDAAPDELADINERERVQNHLSTPAEP